MKTIIAGGRHITKSQFDNAFNQFPYKYLITEVVSGVALGVDTFGELWADNNEIVVTPFEAEWNNFDLPFCVIKYTKNGRKYNAAAGVYRNQQMAEYADMLVLIYDGESSGSTDMLNRATQQKLVIWAYNTTTGEINFINKDKLND